MDENELETKWRKALSSILDELTEDEFRKLLFNLEKIPQGVKEGQPRGNMPSLIIQYYGTEESITLIDNLMKILPRLDYKVQQPLRGMKDELKKYKEVSGGSGETQSLDDSIEKLIENLSLSPQAPQEKSISDLKSSGILETEAIVGKVVKKSKLLYPESPLTSIKDIKSSPLKTYVSVEGTVTEIEPVIEVKVQHEEKKTNRQKFTLKQEADRISVNMWGEATEQSKDLSVGDVLLLKNMKRMLYFGNVYLSSTQFTKITKVPAASS
ncbi:NACHT LRR and PYD domains-containing protein 10 [Dissostichus eleginoides]|uniref:NACHT LRR and PYD domains-containing protein 10 n=1 Tax=Dissostichus eleginoides TaxID=100907 RepID=A0AAD9B2V4_DISEL|nr:NACHT LRR and PYD domains-containing protein 10 [Dissostichus eleginoides]